SYTVAQFLIIEKLLSNRNKRLLVTRKYNPSLKVTTWQLVHEILNELEIPYMENKTEQVLQLPRRNEIYFRGLDDAEKIKSSEFNYIWMEEATEFTFEDYLQLKLRLRRATTSVNQMFLTFNPVAGWTQKQFFEQESDDIAILHTTYQDNPFLDIEYTKMLEFLKDQDEAYYQIYTLGRYAILKNKIYNNYQIVSKMPENFDEIIYGVDFGYNNPSVVLEIGLKDDNIYITKELYETRLTNEELIEKLKYFVKNKNAEIYADSAEPARIEEISRAGFNIFPAKKDIKNGIDFIKRKKIYIHETCTNTIKEIQSYKWKEKKDGEILDEPVKFLDHAMDALRYAVYTHQNQAVLVSSKLFID
ncbi:MAG TPA: PBSX family phage terminase large subunit, partial [Pseudothermotoga sp.]